MSREKALQRLFALWIILPALPLLLITMQSIAGKYGANSGAAWSWFLIQVSPAVALLSAAAFSNPSAAWKRSLINPFRWRLVLALSILQPVAMLGVLLIEPVLEATIYELFDRTAVGLSLLQGFVVAAIGAVVFDGR